MEMKRQARARVLLPVLALLCCFFAGGAYAQRAAVTLKATDTPLEQVTKQLNKMVDVIKLKQLDSSNDICRELMLIKVRCNAKNRSDLIDIAQLMEAKISDLSTNSFTLEISDTPQRLALLEEMLRPYGILEEVRTGAIALQHGTEIL